MELGKKVVQWTKHADLARVLVTLFHFGELEKHYKGIKIDGDED
jgi:hypothetical protein